MLVQEMKSVFASWKAQDLLAAGIRFRESSDPAFDPHSDYQVIYEASFEPNTLNKARLEFGLTDAGHVLVGVETYDRIARRLGLRPISSGFAAGHEPGPASEEALKTLFDAVSQGNMSIAVTSVLWFVTSARLCMPEPDLAMMAHSGYQTSWISPISNGTAPASSWFKKVLNYGAW